MYYGVKGTTIEYNPHLREWKMKSVMYPLVFAISKAPFHTLSLGVYTWTVANDIECQKGVDELTLSLSSCTKGTKDHYNYFIQDQDGEFMCHDGLCVDLDKRCDGFVDCQVIILLFTIKKQTNIFY